MRFWPPFHLYSLDIVSNAPNKLIFRAPSHVRLQMTVDHLDLNQDPGSCLTHYNHDTCLWEFYHSPCTIGYHRLFIWLLDDDESDQWTTAVRFDVYIEQRIQSLYYPITTNIFNTLRCQLISPMNGIILKEFLPLDIIIRVPAARDVQLQLDEQTLVTGDILENDIYRLKVPSVLPDSVRNLNVMALCFDNMFFSTLIIYNVE